jgi:hypothetical protein
VVLVAAVASLMVFPVADAGAAGRRCHTYPSSGPGEVTYAHNMSCRAAAEAWTAGDGSQQVSLHKGGRFHVGRFRCVTYADHTPPGPSDSDVLVRCLDGRRSFRFEYAV